MLRKIVEINEEKCTGCGLCIDACAEGALKLIEGKARLVSDSYCDGLGACLPECPADAINIIERDGAAFDEVAVQQHLAARNSPSMASVSNSSEGSIESQLSHWPVQMKLVPVNAPFLEDAEILIAADCCAYAYGNFHQDFIKGHATLIGCPKLDDVDYGEKLTQIFRLHHIKSVTVTRMTVPCCGQLVNKVKQSVANSGKDIPVHAVTIDTDGTIIEDAGFIPTILV